MPRAELSNDHIWELYSSAGPGDFLDESEADLLESVSGLIDNTLDFSCPEGWTREEVAHALYQVIETRRAEADKE